jgi:aryl-alcohol dehydrogenase-like predicted oxidoreductase
MNLSQLIFGCASITSMSRLSTALQLLEQSYEQGIRHYDTAPLYGRGYSELILGKFLKNKTNDTVVSTKFGLGDQFNTGNIPLQVMLPSNFIIKSLIKKIKHTKKVLTSNSISHEFRRISKRSIEESFYKSLKRLKVERINYYFLHEGFPNFLTDKAKLFLIDLKYKGDVERLGIGSDITKIEKMDQSDLDMWDVLQYEGYDATTTKKLLLQFQNKIHFHHSCLKGVNSVSYQNVYKQDIPGRVLAEKSQLNRLGKILFSTRSKEHLTNNISGFLRYCND